MMNNILSIPVHKVMQEDVADKLEITIEKFHDFMSGIPDSTNAYLNYKPREVCLRRLPPGLTQSQLEIALQLWDVHSFLCSMLLTTIWRTDQLKGSVIRSLHERNLITGASAARALFESACAFYIESNSLVNEIKKAKLDGVYKAEDATKLRISLSNKAIKIALGTRQSDILENHDNYKRTNIQTLINKALKSLDAPEYINCYEKLCDAVHPSFESFSAFTVELGNWEEGSQLRWVMNRYALRPKEIVDTIGFATAWSMERLLDDFQSFYVTCMDLCLSARIPWLEFENQVSYFGLCSPPDIYSLCPCGSGKKCKFCAHSLSSE